MRSLRSARPWHRISALLLLLLVSPTAAEAAPEGKAVELTGKPLQFDASDPKRERVGRLVWRGGLEIRSPDKQVGGLSGLLISEDGRRLWAVTDKARWLSAELSYDAAGNLVGIGEGRIGRLRGLDGKVLKKDRWRDAESLAELADGSVLVAFEREHRIRHYGADGKDLNGGALASLPTAWPHPEGLRNARPNGGLEALEALADGGLLALTEHRANKSGGWFGYLWRDGAWSRLVYQTEGDLKPTGAARLAGSDDLLVVERQFDVLGGVRTRLARLAADDIRPGRLLKGEELARWGLPLVVDNYEGIATRRGANGQILIYLLSDDNFNLLQRSLLVMFELEE